MRRSPIERYDLKKFFLLALFMATPALAKIKRKPEQRSEFENWLELQATRSEEIIFENLRATQFDFGGSPGAVMASPGAAHDPTRDEQQDYTYHWVRDSALVMDQIVYLYKEAVNPEERRFYSDTLEQYVDFTATNQQAETISGLGEPKFHLDGRPFTGEWGRPQNDGPALRALTLLRWADLLVSRQQPAKAVRIYNRVIKNDLQYTLDHFREPSFDIWEEVKGVHFYTLMVQRAALLAGARFARLIGQSDSEGRFREAARQIVQMLTQFVAHDRGHLLASIEIQGGHIRDKTSGLDAAVVLAALHGNGPWFAVDRFFSPTNSWILATVHSLETVFERLFPINGNGHNALMIGRYPEDKYFGGNPWFITTLGVAELYFRAASEMRHEGWLRVDSLNYEFFLSLVPELSQLLHPEQTIASTNPPFELIHKSLIEKGDAILQRVRIRSRQRRIKNCRAHTPSLRTTSEG